MDETNLKIEDSNNTSTPTNSTSDQTSKLISKLSQNDLLSVLTEAKRNTNNNEEKLNENDFNDDEDFSPKNNFTHPPKNQNKKKSKLELFIEDSKYTWEREGTSLINSNKVSFSRKDKKILKTLLLTQIPENLRKQVLNKN